MTASDTPRVVIIGAGFAGLYVAKGLKHAPVRVTVVDRRNHHLFQPMLYQVATAALNPSDIATPIRSILRNERNVEVLLANVTGIDRDARVVHCDDGESLPYDYCVVAVGAQPSYFGHRQWEPLAPTLKTLDNALDVRRRIFVAFEYAERASDADTRRKFLTFVIVGGGPTGVELAGAVAEIRRYALSRDFRHINPREASVVLIEAGKRILPAYPEALSTRARQELQSLGVDVREGQRVTGISRDAVSGDGWNISTTTVVWAAGNHTESLLDTLGAEQDTQGRVKVTPGCTVPGHPELFVLGDAAAVPDDRFEGGTVPAIAPAAIQMGEYAAREIAAAASGTPRRPFHYRNKGQLAVVGRGRAVADLPRLRFGGALAWLIWIFVHITYLIGFRNRMLVLIEWAWSYLTYGRGARLITGHDGVNEAGGSAA
jgi:NADH:quinone reductase (non-electrogenic)